MGAFLLGLVVGIVLMVIAIGNKWIDIEKIKKDQNKQS